MVTTYDLVAFDGAGFNTFKETTQSLFTGTPPGQLCAGPQKLAQKWLLELLTTKGSMPLHMATRGSTFISDLRRRVYLNQEDVKTAFGFAEFDIRQTLKKLDTVDTPKDEQIASASLQAVVLGDAYIQLTVKITTEAGSSISFATPISTAPASFTQ